MGNLSCFKVVLCFHPAHYDGSVAPRWTVPTSSDSHSEYLFTAVPHVQLLKLKMYHLTKKRKKRKSKHMILLFFRAHLILNSAVNSLLQRVVMSASMDYGNETLRIRGKKDFFFRFTPARS